MRKFVSGFLVATVLLFSGTVFANSYSFEALSTDLKILLNGEEQVLEDDPVIIEGRTYLPVRSLSNMLSVNVDYDHQKKEVGLSSLVTNFSSDGYYKMRDVVEYLSSTHPDKDVSMDRFGKVYMDDKVFKLDSKSINGMLYVNIIKLREEGLI